MAKENGKILMLVTASSSSEAAQIGKTLVEKQLAACCSIVPNVQSIYWWEGKICEDAEVLLMIKTTKSVESMVIETIKSLHSYDVPEMISLPIGSGYEKYLQWIEESVSVS